MTREVAQTLRAHGDDDSEVAHAVGVKQDEHSGTLAGRQAVPKGEWRWFIGAQAGNGGLGEMCQLWLVPKQPKTEKRPKLTAETVFKDAIVDAS